jgi:hypothetical protein
MTIRRKAPNAYTDEEPDISRAICHDCYEKGLEVFLVPYVMENGRRDDHFRRCPECAAIIPRKLTRYHSETGPLGSTSGVGEAKYEVIVPRRRMRRDDPREDNKQDIPKLAGKKDIELELFVNEGAIILSINDSYLEETE